MLDLASPVAVPVIRQPLYFQHIFSRYQWMPFTTRKADFINPWKGFAFDVSDT